MQVDYKKYIKPIILGALAIILIFCLIKKPEGIKDIYSYTGYAILILTFISALYVKFIWKWSILRKIGFEEIPVLKKKYEGTIKYNFNGGGEKPISFKVKQTLLSTKIIMTTDINRSTNITSQLIKENDEFILYYTYITNPQSTVRATNPIQYATTRILIEDVDDMQGMYWTTSQTTGDIFISSVN